MRIRFFLYNFFIFLFEKKNTKNLLLLRIHHKSTAADKFSVIETRLLWARLPNLKPNSQHVVYVIAVGPKGMSLPSETLIAWTDPALPAFVDVSNNNFSRFFYSIFLLNNF